MQALFPSPLEHFPKIARGPIRFIAAESIANEKGRTVWCALRVVAGVNRLLLDGVLKLADSSLAALFLCDLLVLGAFARRHTVQRAFGVTTIVALSLAAVVLVLGLWVR